MRLRVFSFKLNLFLVITDCFFIEIVSYCLNPNLGIKLCTAVVLQSIITLVTNSLRIKILLGCFLVHLLVHIYVFYDLKDILMLSPTMFYDLNLLLYFFHLTTIFRHYLLLSLHHFFHTFFCLHQPFYLENSTAFWEFLISSFILLYSLNMLFTEANSSWLIYESLKVLLLKLRLNFV